jgi:hypothetical protein
MPPVSPSTTASQLYVPLSVIDDGPRIRTTARLALTGARGSEDSHPVPDTSTTDSNPSTTLDLSIYRFSVPVCHLSTGSASSILMTFDFE